MTFIFGVDNYSSFEYPESREIMKKFVNKNPQALATPLIKLFLENTKINNKLGIIEYKDPNKDTYELINTELEKQLGVKDISELSESYE